MTDWSQAETRALAARAAVGAGLPPAQAALYAQAACHHLAEGGAADALSLDDPALPALITRIAVLPAGPFALPEHPLAQALVHSLPGNVSNGAYDPERPKQRSVPKRLTIPSALQTSWKTHAAKTYVPDSATSHAGAGGSDD